MPITYPGKSQENASAFTQIIDKNQNVLESTAFSFEETLSGVQGRFWHNGKLMANITVNDQGTVTYAWVFDEKLAGTDLIGKNFVAQGEKAVNEFIEQLSYQNSKQGKTNSFLDSSKANASPIVCLNNCFSNLGLPAAVVALIGVACAVACTATFGVGCAPCLALLIGGNVGLIAFCVDQCF
ncbi:hypothetical protein [Nostoc sp. GT001]|uniref:hypothetical protein n=1 Tax=Nostoc sp. GT001 TaxID=3056647 RepID=UPI0025AB531D|nr:hypothetical protein [Nostoc sp. GT001]MDM9584248.1 hypothetical protein [Nostoc sp. GT001]